MKNNLKSRLIGLLIVGSVALSFNLKVFISIVNPVSDAAAESVQDEEAKLASSLPRLSTTRSEEAPKAVTAALSHPKDLLPSRITLADDGKGARSIRRWTIKDIVEIREITSVAVSERTRQVAFTIKQAFADTGDIRYGLYEIDLRSPHVANKLVEGGYLADLSWRPGATAWTVLAEFGEGVQLYEIDSSGPRPLITNSNVTKVGSWEGVVAGLDVPHLVGILSYEWSPDGKSLWYSRLRLRSPQQQKSFTDEGIVYDDRTLSGTHFRNYPGLLEGFELRVVRFDDAREDRLLVFLPSVASTDIAKMRRDWGTAYWSSDSRHILYSATTLNESGVFESIGWSVDVTTGGLKKVSFRPEFAVPVHAGTSSLSLNLKGGTRHLVAHAIDGSELKDYGPVQFKALGLGLGLGAWRGPADRDVILGVSYDDYDALVKIGNSVDQNFAKTTDSLNRCSFTKNLRFGACVRQSLAVAPELILIKENGNIQLLVQPNSAYAEIRTLVSEPATWVNRYGNKSTGYITYPRDYVVGHKYPTIVITHANSARNTFLDSGFQAEIPLQVLAESGYIVLSVNESPNTYRLRASLHERQNSDRNSAAEMLQFAVVEDAVATMEASLQSLIDRRIVDIEKTGIAGYSRGAEVATYVMSQSKMFRAASIGDGAAAVNADGYWSWGTRLAPAWYRNLFGGSPYDSDPWVQGNYRKFSPSFRANSFAGPLLQQPALVNAAFAFELNTMLRLSQVPAELVYFPGEAHIFWNPRSRVAAMGRTLDWFNYWLLGKVDSNETKRPQYDRWSKFVLRPSRDTASSSAEAER